MAQEERRSDGHLESLQWQKHLATRLHYDTQVPSLGGNPHESKIVEVSHGLRSNTWRHSDS